MAIQQLYLGLGAKKKTYIDDVFSTYLWKGNGSTATINNGIDMSGVGAMTWIKQRQSGGNDQHFVYDTVRGATKRVLTDGSSAEGTTSAGLTQFNNNGFNLGSTHNESSGSQTYASWSFAKTPGFFDVVKYTGSGSTQQIAHSLGCIPGCYMIKNLDNSGSWMVYHRQLNNGVNAAHYRLSLNSSSVETDADVFGDTAPTATHFTAGGSHQQTNASGDEYICYLFAGGESTAATARSVNFDGSSDYLHSASSSDLTMGTGDFTVEGWIKFKSVPTGHGGFYQISSTATGLQSTNYGQTIAVGYSGDNWRFYGADGGPVAAADSTITAGDWYHIAHVRSSGVSKLYVNGVEVKSKTDTYNYNGTYLCIGSYYQASFSSNAYISNFRVVKGTAVYTSSFRPPTEPLTNITNTKVLCCNNTSITGKTVGPTLTDYGNVAASTDSPFDDPAAFTFGDSKEGIVKCGSFIGNHTNKPEIYLGWEPQYLLWKNADQDQDWFIVDSMRGAVSGGNDARLRPNTTVAENTSQNPISLTSAGFKCTNTDFNINGNNDTTIYIAIRRPDGYVGKPADAGTDVFAMDTGNSSSTIPTFDSGFPVDFGFYRIPTQTQDFTIGARLTGTKYMLTNANNSEADNSYHLWDSNVGWAKGHNSSHQSWMWKRGAGFDVVTYTGNGTFGHVVNHSMNKIPEMIWIKERDNSVNWYVNHIALTGGGSYASWRGALKLNSTAATWESANILGGASTSSTFTVGGDNDANQDGDNYLALLFASVNGISKVGSYTGNGSNTGPSISLGFQPRFIIIKAVSQTGPWRVLDSVRGMGSGNDKSLRLESTAAQVTDFDWLDATSTGFDIKTSDGEANASGALYLYYAHA